MYMLLILPSGGTRRQEEEKKMAGPPAISIIMCVWHDVGVCVRPHTNFLARLYYTSRAESSSDSCLSISDRSGAQRAGGEAPGARLAKTTQRLDLKQSSVGGGFQTVGSEALPELEQAL